MVASTAAAGGMVATRKVISRSELLAPGVSLLTWNIRLSALVSAARKLSASMPKLGIATITTSAARAAAHTTSRPGGYHSSVSLAGAGALAGPAIPGRASSAR